MQHKLIDNMIHMQFLMYENARQAAGILVDEGPNRTGTLISILASELTLYPHLCERFKDDLKIDRLKGREIDYHKIVKDRLREINYEIKNKDNPEYIAKRWKKAKELEPFLLNSYNNMCQRFSYNEK
jgi:hypothetical protein